MPAELRLDRLGHLALLQALHRRLELRHHLARPEPAEIAARRGGTVAGVGLRHLGKVLAAIDLGLELLRLLLALDEDVRGVPFRRRLEVRDHLVIGGLDRVRRDGVRDGCLRRHAREHRAALVLDRELHLQRVRVRRGRLGVREQLLVDHLVEQPLQQRAIRQVLILRRQRAHHRDDVAERDLRAVHGREHGIGGVGLRGARGLFRRLGIRGGRGLILGKARHGDEGGDAGHQAGGKSAAHTCDLPSHRRFRCAFPCNSACGTRQRGAVDRRGTAAYIPRRLKPGCSRRALLRRFGAHEQAPPQ